MYPFRAVRFSSQYFKIVCNIFMFAFIDKKYLFISTFTVLFLFSAYTLFISVNSHLQFINFSYQHEFREGAALNITKLYINHENPFDIRHQPQDSYVYGFLYPLVVSPFAKAYGNTLAVHRWVSYVFILLTCLLIFLALNSIKLNPVFSFAAAVILHQSFIFYNGLVAVARPEGLGIFLFTLGILIPWRFKFSSWSCLVSIFLGILAYLTKPYYILIIPFVAIYMFLFVSKRKALFYGLISVFLVLIMVIAVALIYETYHNNTFFIQNNLATYVYIHMKEQLFGYLKVNIFLFIIIIFCVLIIFKNFLYHDFKNIFKDVYHKIHNKFLFNKNINIFKDEPVVKTSFDMLFSFVFLFTLVLFVVKFGGHTGSYRGQYLFHLTSPFLILTTFQFIKISNNKVFQSAIAVLLILSLRLEFKAVNYNFERFTSDYKKTEDIIGKSKNPLNSPETVSIVLQQNKSIYNSGHSECFPFGISELSLFLGASSDVAERNNEFKKEINEKIRNKEFDLILISKISKVYNNIFIEPNLLAQNYQCADTLNGPLTIIETWYPIK